MGNLSMFCGVENQRASYQDRQLAQTLGYLINTIFLVST
jgi:hypothetical protein